MSIEVVRVTEAAALASAQWIGRGKKDEADEAATKAMRDVFDTIPMNATVVIGEGEMDEAPIKGVHWKGKTATTQSIVMRAKSGTVRFIEGQHSMEKKPNLVIS